MCDTTAIRQISVKEFHLPVVSFGIVSFVLLFILVHGQAAPPRLVVLDLGHNFLDDEAIDVIARGLEKNRVLTTLILQGNGIGEKVR